MGIDDLDNRYCNPSCGTMLMSIATNIAVITNKTEQQQTMEQQFLIAKARIVEAQQQQQVYWNNYSN
jgi:hypothetical protein